MVERPSSAVLGSVLFPELGAGNRMTSPVSVANRVETSVKQREDMCRRAYRDGYAAGYSTAWSAERRKAAPVLGLLGRLASDFRGRAERARHDVELRTDEIVRAVAANLVAREIAAISADN